MPDDPRFTDPVAAVDHIRRLARETAATEGYRAAADAAMNARREYRIMPLKRSEAAPDRLATWDAVRLETRSLVPMAMGGSKEHALFDERVATPGGQPLPQQPGWAPDPAAALQAAALRAQHTRGRSQPQATSQGQSPDRAPGR